MVIIVGFFLWKQKSEPGEVAAVPVNMMAETVPEKGMVSSIKEAMDLGKKMQCTYVINQDGGLVESKGSIDGENQYSWTSAAKTGMKMSKACLEKMGESVKNMP